MTTANQFKGMGQRKNYENDEEFGRQVVSVVNNILLGKTNNTGVMTVASGTTTTTVLNPNVGNDSVLPFVALDADSADTTSIFLSERLAGESFTFTHDSSGNTRTYDYVIIG